MPVLRLIRRSALHMLCALPICGLSHASHAADVHVLATGALSAAFKEVVPAFEEKTGHHLVISWGPSYGASPDALPMRIRNGEPMDVCFMIAASLDDQIRLGNFDPGSRVDLVSSGIGVAVRVGLDKPPIQTIEQLRQSLLAAKSVAFSEGASGTYITGTLFEKLGIATQMKEKSVLIKGRELVGQALERGDADLGLQQISELRAIRGIQCVGPLPAAVQKVSVVSAAIAPHAKERAAAQALIDYLRSPEVTAALLRSGLDPIQP